MEFRSGEDFESICIRHGVTPDDIVAARKRIEPYINKTHIFSNAKFDEMSGKKSFFKAENLQVTGSFKARGALNCILLMKETHSDMKGVVTHSSGNHGQAVAWAATMCNLKCVVVVPKTAPRVKVEAIKSYGAELIFCEPNPTARSTECDKIVQERGYVFISSSNHPYVIAGQGTIALEMLEECPDLDAILVSASGGGMISGIAIAAKSINRNIKVYMTEPEGKMAEKCIRSRERLWPNPPQFLNTIADGIILQQLSPLPFKIICDLVEKDVISVNDEDIINGMRFCFQNMKVNHLVSMLNTYFREKLSPALLFYPSPTFCLTTRFLAEVYTEHAHLLVYLLAQKGLLVKLIRLTKDRLHTLVATSTKSVYPPHRLAKSPVVCQSIRSGKSVNGRKSTILAFELVIEGAAGATVAAATRKKFREVAPSVKNLGIVLCGGNVDLDKLPWLQQNSNAPLRVNTNAKHRKREHNIEIECLNG